MFSSSPELSNNYHKAALTNTHSEGRTALSHRSAASLSATNGTAPTAHLDEPVANILPAEVPSHQSCRFLRRDSHVPTVRPAASLFVRYLTCTYPGGSQSTAVGEPDWREQSSGPETRAQLVKLFVLPKLDKKVWELELQLELRLSREGRRIEANDDVAYCLGPPTESRIESSFSPISASALVPRL